MLLWFVFGVFGIVPEVLKMLVFFSLFFGLLWGGLVFFILGLEGLGVFVFLAFVFVFCVVLRVFLFCLLCFCFVVGLFLVLVLVLLLFLIFVFLFYVSSFCLCFVSFVVVLLGGFKGQVRWSKGPPHLALNPPYFCFCFCFFDLVFLFFVFAFCCFLIK